MENLKIISIVFIIFLIFCAKKPFKETAYPILGNKDYAIVKAFFSKGISETVKLYYFERDKKTEIASYSLHNTMDSPFCVRLYGDTLLLTYVNDQIQLRTMNKNIRNYFIVFKPELSDNFWKYADANKCVLIE
jgi:hypothetical protein